MISDLLKMFQGWSRYILLQTVILWGAEVSPIRNRLQGWKIDMMTCTLTKFNLKTQCGGLVDERLTSSIHCQIFKNSSGFQVKLNLWREKRRERCSQLIIYTILQFSISQWWNMFFFSFHVKNKFFYCQKVLRAETEEIARWQYLVDKAPRLISEKTFRSCWLILFVKFNKIIYK